MILKNFPTLAHDDNSDFLSPEIIAALLEKAQRVDELTQTVELKSELISSLKHRVEILEEALRLTKIKRFAPSSEKSGQSSLFDDAETEATIDFDAATDETAEDEDFVDAGVPESRQPKLKTGRKPFSKDLPREQIFIRLSDEEKQGAISTFFTKVKEELDIIPAQVRVLEYMQEKAVFRKRSAQPPTLKLHPVI